MIRKGNCWHCGYCLLGIPSVRCPECGNGPKPAPPPPPPAMTFADAATDLIDFAVKLVTVYLLAMIGPALLVAVLVCLSLVNV